MLALSLVSSLLGSQYEVKEVQVHGLNSEFQTCVLLESHRSKSGSPQTHEPEGVKWSELEISFL